MLMADEKVSKTVKPDSSTPNEKPDLDNADTRSNWQFSASDQSTESVAGPDKPSAEQSFSWSASEFIAHTKNPGWYAALAMVTLAIAGLLFLLTHDKVTTIFIVIGGGILGFMGSRQPRELPYTVSDKGLQVGSKEFLYTSFRSFSIVQEVGIESIWLMPMKKYMPAISLYFEPNDQQKIVDVISNHLPMENRELDPFDKLMHQIRF